MLVTLGLAYLAGLLTLLSPCVLPLVPVALAAAQGERRLGPVALGVGLTLSFVAVGLFVATVGFSIGLDETVFRPVAAALLMVVGAVLLVPAAQARVANAAGPASHWAAERLDLVSRAGLAGQFLVGLLLGVVWAPCVGPTLGAASMLAARGEDLGSVAATMGVFGLGAATPLVLLGLMSSELLQRWRARMAGAGRAGRIALGIALILVGLAVVSGYDKRIETALVDASPDWLNALTTRF
ncbi:cytochrome c biogenesis CcdA family protein [Chenggangzhangella methanolivorans]|uniref:Sulfite exporter TauE/SafE family protein n=1 Tax=Chenggangzhangella methanolivorans TaxID=1437009 RepID=A0A9E6RDY9_9HYPH|nr:cytochrome c biogenesis protein CcdA [Chenggangzhangella methanolivorans]QZO02190.1 sulfite exporter TauE/SafE family protein [Chenggangzhangella methanolivorans]